MLSASLGERVLILQPRVLLSLHLLVTVLLCYLATPVVCSIYALSLLFVFLFVSLPCTYFTYPSRTCLPQYLFAIPLSRTYMFEI